jgi:hypothetical protein
MRGPRRGPSQRSGYKPMPQNEATARTTTVPAPVGGWNARDSLAAMQPLDAVVMDNFFPGTSDVSLRPGSSNWLTGLPSNARAFLPYNKPIGGTLFVSTSTGIYDATSSGPAGSAVTTCTNGEWNSVSFINTAGAFLVAVNGVDKLKLYNGTSWINVDATSTPAITGVVTSNLENLCLHKRRLWFTEKSSMDLWYLATDAIGGAATRFPVGPLFARGGRVVAVASWTIDGGKGVDDLLVIVSSEGELAVYQGTDPASPANFALVGVYYVGEPIGKRCLTRYGGDLLYLSKQGCFPLSKQLLSATIDRSQAISFKIDGAFLAATTAYGGVSGWEAVIYPDANALIVNVPISDDNISYQYIMNNITKAWCRFVGWNARCFTVFNGELYFAGQTTVKKAWGGLSDSGLSITGQIAQAYNKLGVGGQKSVSLARTNVAVEGQATLALSLDVDYKGNAAYTQNTYLPLLGTGLWDTSLWDTVVWSSDINSVESKWLTVPNDLGYLYSLKMQLVTSTARFSWTSTDFAVRPAGIL